MSNTTARSRFHWIPNAITLSRIALIPVLIWGILNLGKGAIPAFWIVALYIGCALSDFADGFIARKYGFVSNLGRMLDPIADKLMVAGCLIAIVIRMGGIWIILVPALAVAFRDIFVAGTREYAALEGKVMPPTNLAKWKTAAEMLSILLLMIGIGYATINIPFTDFGIGVLWLAAVLSVYTGALYVRAALR